MLQANLDVEHVESDDCVVDESHEALDLLDHSLEETFLLLSEGRVSLA